LSAITGTSSATAGAAESAFIIAVLDCTVGAAEALPVPGLAARVCRRFLPPLIACKIGLPLPIGLPGFALAACRRF